MFFVCILLSIRVVCVSCVPLRLSCGVPSCESNKSMLTTKTFSFKIPWKSFSQIEAIRFVIEYEIRFAAWHIWDHSLLLVFHMCVCVFAFCVSLALAPKTYNQNNERTVNIRFLFRQEHNVIRSNVYFD